MLDFINSEFPLKNILITCIIIVTLMVLQSLFLKFLAKKKWQSEKVYLRVNTHVRNVFIALITLSIITVWIPQIQSFALSIAAIAVAVVVSIKEIITMLTGGFIRSSTDLLDVGDRIEINHIKGDVMRIGFFNTDLLEVGECGQRTGRITHLPNNYFFTYPLVNEGAVGDFTFHTISLPLEVKEYSEVLKASLLDFVTELSKPYLKSAEEKFKKFSRKNGISGLTVQPRILLQPIDHEHLNLVLRFPSPIPEKIKIEQQVIDKFYVLLSAQQKSHP